MQKVAWITGAHELVGILNAIVNQQVFWKDPAALDISPLTPAGTRYIQNLSAKQVLPKH
jgi:hypothetical protein